MQRISWSICVLWNEKAKQLLINVAYLCAQWIYVYSEMLNFQKILYFPTRPGIKVMDSINVSFN